MRTALVRTQNGNLKIIKDDCYSTQKEMAIDLKGNGFKVLKIWNLNKTEQEVDYWELLNRK